MTALVDTSLQEIVGALHADRSELFVIAPSPALLKAVVETGSDRRPSTHIRVLAAESTLKEAFADFHLATRAADLVSDDHLALRVLGVAGSTQLVLADDRVTTIIEADGLKAGLSTTERDIQKSVETQYAEQWAASAEFSLRTPPLSRLEATLREQFSPAAADTFTTLLAATEAVRSDTGGLDEVALSLLVAASHEELFYDISRWGEESGIASISTFSRVKTDLEEAGVIETEKVPIEIGRPRLRLLLKGEKLQEASPGELTELAYRND